MIHSLTNSNLKKNINSIRMYVFFPLLGVFIHMYKKKESTEAVKYISAKIIQQVPEVFNY